MTAGETKLEKHTFGAFPAAVVLRDRLLDLNDPMLVRKVSRVLQDFNTGLACLENLDSKKYASRMSLLWRKDFLNRVRIDERLDSYVKNVIVGHHRDFLRWLELRQI